tara:strand:+ start:287 stop:490 length:204 start_codon:yes stop_codon:yes gene_type:complete
MDLNKSFIRIKEVIELTTLSKSTIYRMVRKNEFPKPISIKSLGNISLFVREEVQEWIETQINTCRVA